MSKQAKTDRPINKKLSQEIQQMAALDQKWRAKWGASNFEKLQPKILAIDRKHTDRLEQIIKEYGWPTISLVGKKASNMAWLLAQHASCDLSFQEKCLKLLKKEVIRKDATPQNYAYLLDRVRVSKNLPQFFGTQFKQIEHGRMIPFPIYRAKEVNQRRKKYGLESLEAYNAKILKMHSKRT